MYYSIWKLLASALVSQLSNNPDKIPAVIHSSKWMNEYQNASKLINNQKLFYRQFSLFLMYIFTLITIGQCFGLSTLK